MELVPGPAPTLAIVCGRLSSAVAILIGQRGQRSHYPRLRVSFPGERLQSLDEDRTHAGALLKRTDPSPLEHFIVDGNGEIGHASGVARDPCDRDAFSCGHMWAVRGRSLSPRPETIPYVLRAFDDAAL